MKKEVSNTRIILSGVQSGANTDLVLSSQLDPFDRNLGFNLTAVEARLNPTDIADIAADASIQIQFVAWSVTTPTADYAFGDAHIITQWCIAIPLTTSGVGVVDCNWVYPIVEGNLVIGSEYLGVIVESKGCTAAINAEFVFYGDSVTLTADEIATSRLRFS